MTDHRQLCDELLDVIRKYEHGVNTAQLNVVKADLKKILKNEWVNAYVREKALYVSEGFQRWFSARKWKQYPHCKQQIIADIARLRSACETASR